MKHPIYPKKFIYDLLNYKQLFSKEKFLFPKNELKNLNISFIFIKSSPSKGELYSLKMAKTCIPILKKEDLLDNFILIIKCSPRIHVNQLCSLSSSFLFHKKDEFQAPGVLLQC